MGDQINLGETKEPERRSLEKKLSFCHFSHEHPLKQTNSPLKENIFCSACNLNIISTGNSIKDYYYTCKTCPFFLHNVCHKMPEKTLHPANPAHQLTLQFSTSSSIENLKCQACGDHIHGSFFYSCSECSLCCYHVLCSQLPLLVSVSSHTHELKLTFSPPYNFSCDICRKPSYNGWLYRCQICEFDTHLFCAISNRRTQGSHRSADYNNEVDEVMQLVTQALLYQNEESVDKSQELVEGNAVFRLLSPDQNLNVTGAKFCAGPLDQTKIYNNSPNPGKPFLHQSPLTPVSEDMSTLPSYQFSDACFSIDLAKSYSSYDAMNLARIEANGEQGTKGRAPEVKGATNKSHKNNKIRQDNQKQLSYGTNIGTALTNSLSMGRDERLMKDAFLVRSDTLAREEFGQFKGKKSKANETKGRSAIANQSIGSNTNWSSGSSWQKILLCFCHSR